jgi:hypothetical protein
MESDLHRSMKGMIRQALEVERYRVMEEPLYPPARWIHWESYRPDLLGLRSDNTSEQLVIVECETHPNMKRLLAKNFASLWFEPSVLRDGSIRRILAIPRGNLSKLDLRLRNRWEVWILGATGPLVKIPTIHEATGVEASGESTGPIQKPRLIVRPTRVRQAGLD